MSAAIRVAIRADAGTALGTGHFARASAVADALAAAGGTEVMLVTGEEGAALVPAYFPSGISVVALKPGNTDPASSMEALRRKGWAPDVVYLDQYGEVPCWEAQAAEAGAGLVVLDDLDAASRADIIVRPHGGKAGPAGGIVLRGPAHLPLSRHVTALADRPPPRTLATRPRLNICFGGSDPTEETAKALRALAELDGSSFDVDSDRATGPVDSGPSAPALMSQLRALSTSTVPGFPRASTHRNSRIASGFWSR